MKVNLICRRGFTIIELFISMVIIAIFTSFITSNISSQSQTVKSEAEKLAAYITDLTRKADRRHINFTIVFHSDNAYSYFGTDDDSRTYIFHENPENIKEKYDKKIIMNPGFTLSHNFFTKLFTDVSNVVYSGIDTKDNLVYKSNENEFNHNCTITMTRTLDKTNYYVVVENGRVRASEEKPE